MLGVLVLIMETLPAALADTEESPFLVTSGIGCESLGHCLRSSRRRQDKGLAPGAESCEVLVATGTGPIVNSSLDLGGGMLLANGVSYTKQRALRWGTRLHGTIVWSSAVMAAGSEGAGWELCVRRRPSVDDPEYAQPREDPCSFSGDSNSSSTGSIWDGCSGTYSDEHSGSYSDEHSSSYSDEHSDDSSGSTSDDVLMFDSKEQAVETPGSGLSASSSITSMECDDCHKTLDSLSMDSSSQGSSSSDSSSASSSGSSDQDTDGCSYNQDCPHSSDGPPPLPSRTEHFQYPEGATPKTVALLACEMAHGAGNCVDGSCRCFKYFFRRGSLSCNCQKARGEYEFVYENRMCTDVSEDYNKTFWQGLEAWRSTEEETIEEVPSGERSYSTHTSGGDTSLWRDYSQEHSSVPEDLPGWLDGATSFVRRRQSDCDAYDIWELVQKLPSKKLQLPLLPDNTAGCGESCAASANTLCDQRVNGCSSLLTGKGSPSCADWRSLPHAHAASCDEHVWVRLDMGKPKNISEVRLFSCEEEQHCGRSVELSQDGEAWDTVYKQAPGYGPVETKEGTLMTFAKQAAQHVRVSSSRSSSASTARFLRVQVSEGACLDHPTWTDSRFGDGSKSCEALSALPSWCFLRGRYSQEAQHFCPKTCLDCSKPFEKAENCTILETVQKSTHPEHVASAISCYWQCLATEPCTHFRWRAGESCILLRGKDGGNEMAYKVPRKMGVSEPLQESLVTAGFVSLFTKDDCEVPIIEEGHCMLALTAAQRQRFGSDQVIAGWTAGSAKERCAFRADGAYIILKHRGDCSNSTICVCADKARDAVPVETWIATQAPKLIAPTDWRRQHTSTCVVKNKTMCRGTVRKLFRSSLDVHVGPGLVPYFADWDMDGDLDLLLGQGSGHLVYIENVSGALDLEAALGFPKKSLAGPCHRSWRDHTATGNYSEAFVECKHWCCYRPGGNVCASPGLAGVALCETATAWNLSVTSGLVPVAFDWDGDSDLDLLVASCDGVLQYYERDGEYLNLQEVSPFSAIFSDDGEPGCIFPEVVDWDADGDQDLLLGRLSGSVEFYENVAGHLKHRAGDTNPLFGVSVAGRAVPCAADWDGDGDTDLLVGSSTGEVELFERTEHGSLVRLGPLAGLEVAANSAVRALDWDSNGETDLVVADGTTGQLILWLSYTDKRLKERKGRNNPFADIRVSSVAVPHVVDWNGDNLMDLLIGERDGRIYYYEAALDGMLVLNSEGPFAHLSGLGASPAPQTVDWDGDGDLDLLVGCIDGTVLYFEQTQKGQLSKGQPLHIHIHGMLEGMRYASPHAVDWDGDGDMDLFLSWALPVPRRIQLKGFPGNELNVWFQEQGEDTTIIGGQKVLVSDSGDLMLAYCKHGYWFMFRTNSPETMQENVRGECKGALAKRSGKHLMDRGRLRARTWSISASYATSVFKNTSHRVISDGSVHRPRCNTCTNRMKPECDVCQLSKEMEEVCVFELCQSAGFVNGILKSMQLIDGRCACKDFGGSAKDIYNTSCAEYQTSWCSHYDHPSFSSKQLCCACGGGSGCCTTNWVIDAYCYYANDEFLPSNEAYIKNIRPSNNDHASGGGHVQYLERISPDSLTGLKERKERQSPLPLTPAPGRTFPLLMDWDGDNTMEYILGYQSSDAATASSTGTSEQPYCQIPGPFLDPSGRLLVDGCVWDTEKQKECAKAICRAAGYSSGTYVNGGNACEADWVPWKESQFAGGYAAYDIVERVMNYHEFGKPSFRVAQSGMRDNGSRIVNVTALCEGRRNSDFLDFEKASPVRYFRWEHNCDIWGNGRRCAKEFWPQSGVQNPFDDLVSTSIAVVQVVDWDQDGVHDVVFSDGTDVLKLYSVGEPCDKVEQCNGRGFCSNVKNTCSCIAGHGLADCSGCEGNFYSGQKLEAVVAPCLPCPGVVSGTPCAARGSCIDDAKAQLRANSSNATVSFHVGSGHCECSTYFHGVTTLGLSSCAHGQCPAGKEFHLSSSVGYCRPCLPGYYKREEGDHACQACPRGQYSRTGATECSLCEHGKFQERPGQESCQPCLPSTFSTNGSTTCSACPVGRQSEIAGMSECSVCASGHWSSADGASSCSPCSPGRYGLGWEECQNCERGSYSVEEGSTHCTLCSPGSFNPLPFSSAPCQECEVGRFSSVFGADSEDSCTKCEEGSTTINQGATHRSMCIHPLRENFTAIAGRAFSIKIRGNELQASLHHVAILVTAANPLISLPSGDGITYEWHDPLALNGGSYELLWCPGIHGQCKVLPDFAFDLGHLEIIGPLPASFTCVRGRACERLGPVSGVDLQSLDRIHLQGSCGSGPAIAVTQKNPSGAVLETFINGAGELTLGFGPEPISANPADAYSLCWCAMARGQSGGCSTERDFLVSLGSLSVEGPQGGQERSCHLGQRCQLAALQGIGITRGDRMMVLDRCGTTGQAVEGMPGGGIAETDESGDFKFLPLLPVGSPKLLLSVPGLFRLCFCRPMPGQGCEAPGDFLADTGFFTARGPQRDQQFGCFAGHRCVLEGMAGVGLEDGDEVAVQASEALGACDESGNVTQEALGFGLQQTRAVASNKGTSFSLGLLLATAIPGKHRLCWRPKGSDGNFPTAAGLLFLTCPKGTYRLKSLLGVSCADCPWGFYCPGGTRTGSFEDDTKIGCGEGTTTLTNRSGEAEECLCASGFYRVAGDCVMCPAGLVKPFIGDAISCPLSCPNGTTSRPGASSLQLCYVDGSSRVGEPGSVKKKVTAEIFVVQGKLLIPACLDTGVLNALLLHVKKSIAAALKVKASDVDLTLAAKLSDSCTPGRRLQVSELQQALTYRVAQARQEAADRMTQNINFLEIQAELQEKVGITVAVDAAPAILQEFLNCSRGLSFPLGSEPTSLDECKCAPGFGFNVEKKLCETCTVNHYKGKAADEPCKPCGSAIDARGGQHIRLITLEGEAPGEQFCTCPKGYYAAEGTGYPPETCEPCDEGSYCLGGREKVTCPSGTTTLSRASEVVADCVCSEGWTPLPSRNGTHRCQPCEQGSIKSGVGDDACAQKCPQYSNSELGAVTARDCYCNEDHYWRPQRSSTGNFTGRCLACPADGVHCPGGFEPVGSRTHAKPRSLEGYYMTGLAEAEQCIIEGEEGESVCLPGITAANSSEACGGLQTGVLCGACLHYSARDLGDEACEDCEDFPGWVHVGNLFLDLLLKAAFGIFLGKQAIDSATKSRKMEAVIIRIVLQWVTACSVLTVLDLSSVQVFGWSQESLETAAAEATGSAAEGGNIEAVATATGVSLRFQFPQWFKPIWKAMMFLSGSVPGPISPQFSIECLTQGQMPASTLPSLQQLLVPALWWFVYPLSVTVSVAICCIILAKVFYPLAQWFAMRAKRKVSMRLTRLGVSERTARRALSSMSTEQLKGILDDPAALTSEQGVAEGFGGEVYVEASASFLVRNAYQEHQDMVRRLVERNAANEHLVSVAKALLDEACENKEPLRGFLVSVLKSIDKEKLPNLFDEPTSVPPVLLEHIEGLSADAAAAFQVGGEERCSEGSQEGDAGLGRLSRAADCADEEEFGEKAVGAKDVTKDFSIFGLFRSTNFKDVLWDAFPLYIVTWYSIWDLVTQRMLGLVQVHTVLMLQYYDDDGLEHMDVERRWLYDMRFRIFQGDHLVVGVIGLLGLLIWSISLLLALILKLTRSKNRLQEVSFVRSYGYFYNGLDPNVFWWEVMVKKLDILVIYIVTFTEIFVDPKSKLIMYLGLAGLFWAAHNHYHPYDDRQNSLADRLEDSGLTARFGSLFFLQILLMVNAPPRVNAVVAFLLIVTNAWFLATAVFLLVIEIPNAEIMATDARKAKQAQDAVHERTTGKAAEMFSFGENPFMQLLSSLMNIVVTKVIAPVVRIVLKVFALMARMKSRAARKVPHMNWQGIGLDLVVVTHVEDKLPCWEHIFSAFVRRLYRLGDMEQKAFLSKCIGQFWDYILNNSECYQLPSCIMDIFFVLPRAIQKERAEAQPDTKIEFHIRVARRVRSTLSCRPSRELVRSSIAQRSTGLSATSSFKRSSTASSLPEFACNGEDLITALLFLQRLPKKEVQEFVMEALVDAPKVTNCVSV